MLLVLPVLALLAAGCSGSSTPRAAGSTGAPSAGAAAVTPTATTPAAGAATSGASKSGSSAQPVPSLVERSGAVAAGQRVRTTPVPFASPARYTDGLTVAVRKIEHGTVTDTGAGAMTGQARTVFTLRLTNGSRSPVDLDQVVISTTYGKSRTAASPVYGGDLGDFAGVVRPGGTATARYGYAIPTSDLGNVVMTVDFDGRHASAVFRGSAR